MSNFIIVGSGAAATGVALQLVRNGIRPIILDVGIERKGKELKVEKNLYDWRDSNDTFDYYIGQNFVGIENLIFSKNGIPKLSSPNFSYIKGSAHGLHSISTERFDVTQSFSFGGLGNAWGAGMYRLVDHDLKGFPFSASDLDPYADYLTEHMGITGEDDDLAEYFGATDNLLPPLTLSRNSAKIFANYRKKRITVNNKGLFVGRPRIAALSIPYKGRRAISYDNTEFWQSSESIYTPSITLNELIENGSVDYRPGLLVHSFAEQDGSVSVNARNIFTNETIVFNADRLMLAAGAVSTTKIVLQSSRDYSAKLPLYDNPKLQLPLVIPSSVGNKLDIRGFGLTQLNLIWDSRFYGEVLQGSLVELTSPMRAEFFSHFPLCASGRLLLIKKLLPALVLIQIFFSGEKYGRSEISLANDGTVVIKNLCDEVPLHGVSDILSTLRSIGLWSSTALVQRPSIGNSLHYACSLPMRENPENYQCFANGLLYGTKRVFICDSASFSTLPAKNMSFGMMSNAMRVADACHH